MSLEYSPMSSVSPGGERGVEFDLSKSLKPEEVISTYTVTSAYPTVLSVSLKGLSEDQKRIQFHLSVDTYNTTQKVAISIVYTGSLGSGDTYEVVQPIVIRIKE